jgi:hypothetical protein
MQSAHGQDALAFSTLELRFLSGWLVPSRAGVTMRSAILLALGLMSAACGHPRDGQTCDSQHPCAVGLLCDLSVGLCFSPDQDGGSNGDGGANADGGPIGACDAGCPSGEICSSGGCVTTSCVGISCDGGVCAGAGECFPQSCNSVPCPAQEVCVNSTCVDVRCAGVNCPNAQTCSDGQCVDATCGFADAGTVCAAAVCAGDHYTPVRICQGGTCQSVNTSTCDPYTCDLNGCKNMCSALPDGGSPDCIAGDYCDAGSCAPLQTNGTSCGSNAQCESTHCVDGLCCDSACPGSCSSCALAGTLGSCTTAPSGTDPRNLCGNYTCDGSGNCQTSCSGGQCTASCKSADYCDTTGHCVTRLPQGAACSPAGTGSCQCTTGNCVDGYCCDTACTANCMGCGVSGRDAGTCSPQTLDTDPRGGCGAYYCDGNGSCLNQCAGTTCGAGSNCKTGSYCTAATAGTCTQGLAAEQPCSMSLACECASGACNIFYRDADGDGYGDINTSTIVCGTTPPAGYVADNTDCCDLDPLAHPGVTGWFTGVDKCNTFDYNCDGSAEQEFVVAATSCASSGSCAGVGTLTCNPGKAGWNAPIPACGSTASWADGTCGLGTCCSGNCANGTGCECGRGCGTPNVAPLTQACH